VYNLLKDFKKVYFRRGRIAGQLEYSFLDNKSKHQNALKNYIRSENSFLGEYIESEILSKLKCFGNPFAYQNNRLFTHQLAVQCNIDVPSTIVCTQKKELISFFSHFNGNVICKGLQEGFRTGDATRFFSNYTSKVNSNFIEKLPETFFPSLFQEQLIKDFEIRIFVFGNKFFSMAIFSQINKSSNVDFRNNKDDNAIRYEPFNLPKTMEAKLLHLLKKLHIDTASIDMVLGLDGKFYFIEINPVGQYDFLSKSCNYNIDRYISQKLSE
jgi:glutathione synthase/RimK-type ligase-like ATP-grasp enzyme